MELKINPINDIRSKRLIIDCSLPIQNTLKAGILLNVESAYRMGIYPISSVPIIPFPGPVSREPPYALGKCRKPRINSPVPKRFFNPYKLVIF